MRYTHRSISITEKSTIGEARRAAVNAAKLLGFDEQRRNDIGIAATEAATNMLVHAQAGEFLVCPYSQDDTVWLDLLAIDSGPGIRDIGQAMEDGYSTSGTAGEGLGAIARLADAASLHSLPGKGTTSWCRFRQGKHPAKAAVGVVSIPFPGEQVCGDSFLFHVGEARSLYLVVDGLGHGAGAAEAADEAVRVARGLLHESALMILHCSHDALKKTRGAAMSVAIVDRDRRLLTYAGIGNVAASLTSGTSSRSLVSQNGTVGAVAPRTPTEYTYPVESNTVLIMYSDGLSSKTALQGYPGIQTRHPALVAGLLYRDFNRKRDDATVLVANIGGALP